jgi:hypothetical protein
MISFNVCLLGRRRCPPCSDNPFRSPHIHGYQCPTVAGVGGGYHCYPAARRVPVRVWDRSMTDPILTVLQRGQEMIRISLFYICHYNGKFRFYEPDLDMMQYTRCTTHACEFNTKRKKIDLFLIK